MRNFFYDVFNSLRNTLIESNNKNNGFDNEYVSNDKKKRDLLNKIYLKRSKNKLSKKNRKNKNKNGDDNNFDNEDLELDKVLSSDINNTIKNISNSNFTNFFSDSNSLTAENTLLNKFINIEKNNKELLVPNHNYCGSNIKLLTKIANNVEPKDDVDVYCLENHINNYIHMFEEDEKEFEADDFLNKFRMHAQKSKSNWSNLIDMLFFIKQNVIGQDLYSTLINHDSFSLSMLKQVSDFFLIKKEKILKGNFDAFGASTKNNEAQKQKKKKKLTKLKKK